MNLFRRLRLQPPLRATAIAAATTFLILGCVILLAVSGLRVGKDLMEVQKRPTEENKREFDASLETVKAVVGGIGTLATIAAGVVLYLNFTIAEKNLQVSEEKQVTERFAKAVELLGNKEVEVRLGGIYALERIAKDSPKDHWTIMEILSAYVRQKSPLCKEPGEQVEEPIVIDVQAAVTVIGRRKVEQDPEGAMIDLRYTSLINVVLERANLQGACLIGADMRAGIFRNAQLQGANLDTALMRGACLEDADLQKAHLDATELQAAFMEGINLEGARLCGADLRGARLNKAKLREAHLEGAKLQESRLNHADLQEAFLTRANLQGARLYKANLQGAFLTGANLQGAELTEANLDSTLASDDQLSEACLYKTILPQTSQLNPNRDCKVREAHRAE